MPELPEVETLRRTLYPHVIGRTIRSVNVRDARLRSPLNSAALNESLTGRKIVELSRRGKYLLFELDRKTGLVVHLGMSGRLLLAEQSLPYATHEHVQFQLDNGRELRFRDPRRFGIVETVDCTTLADYPRFKNLGVEPLTDACTPDYLFALSRGLKKPIKNFLMDSTRLVGVGNIYASESLYVAGIRPTRPAGRLNRGDWKTLTKAVKKVLSEAIRQGGTTISDFQDADGNSGYFQVKLRVYDRKSQPCYRCRTPIRHSVMAGRSTYYCPRCQTSGTPN